VTHVSAIVGLFDGGAAGVPVGVITRVRGPDRGHVGTAKTYPHGVVRLEGQIASDHGGRGVQAATTRHADKGAGGFGTVWARGCYSQNGASELVGGPRAARDHVRPGADALPDALHPRRGANNLILQARTWERTT